MKSAMEVLEKTNMLLFTLAIAVQRELSTDDPAAKRP